MRVVCISDTHGSHARADVPAGDVLIHAGDFTRLGEEREVADFGAFMAEQPHAHKIVVAGNHDFLCERDPERARALLGGATYLADEGCECGGLRLWGSPWQPAFHDWAFNLERGPRLAQVWAEVPDHVDVLVTHTPPAGTLDRTRRGEDVGCEALAEALPRIRPRLHVFGHIHEGYGFVSAPGRLSVNASLCGRSMRLEHRPIVVELDGDGARVVD